jgi:hypothetical protein
MTEYIITGEELLDIEQRIGAFYGSKIIRSHTLQQELQKERERILSELEQIAQHNWEEIETDEGEMVKMCFYGELIGKIEELRAGPGPTIRA